MGCPANGTGGGAQVNVFCASQTNTLKLRWRSEDVGLFTDTIEQPEQGSAEG